MTLSREVEVLHIESEDSTNSLKRIWPSRVEQPAREAKQAVPQLTVLKSPFRFVVEPIIDYVLEIERKNPDRTIAVLLPELVERQWYQYFLSQPACPDSRGSPADAGHDPNRDRQCALVSA